MTSPTVPRSTSRWLEQKRAECWSIGIQHREWLVRQFMEQEQLDARPLLREMVDDLLVEVQGVRLREEVLPLDRYAHAKVHRGKVEISINSRLHLIPGVKHVSGIRYVTKWHESVHAMQDFVVGEEPEPDTQPALFGDVKPARLIVCRSTGSRYQTGSEEAKREFMAETAGLAAAIAAEDLVRCPSFRRIQQWVNGGECIPWDLLFDTAEFIGVNISALTRYFQHRGLILIDETNGQRRPIAAPSLFGEIAWL